MFLTLIVEFDLFEFWFKVLTIVHKIYLVLLLRGLVFSYVHCNANRPYYAYMSTWQRPNDGDFSDRQRTRTDWEMPGMDFPRAAHKV